MAARTASASLAGSPITASNSGRVLFADALGIYDSTVFVGLYLTDGVNDFFLSGLESYSGAGVGNPSVALAGTLADSWLLDYDVFYDFVLTADVEHTSTTDIVPEPASGTLLLLGLGLALARKRRTSKCR